MNALVEPGAVKDRTFHTLDALRGVAALSVVLFHCFYFYGLPQPVEGQVAVDLFFVMSGFIIAYRYDARFVAGLGALAFAKQRLIRLYPLFILASLIGVLPAVVAIALGDGSAMNRGFIASFPLASLMLPSHLAPGTDFVYPLNAPAWTLALEILINIAYAASFRFWTMRRLVGCVLVGFAAVVAAAYHFGTLDVGWTWTHYLGGFARILYGFAAGVLIFRVFERRPFPTTLPWWSLLLIIGVLFFLPPPVVRAWWDFGLVAFVVPAIVIAGVASEPPRRLHAACALAGVYSYVVYSLHFVLIGIFLRLEDRLHFDKEAVSVGKALAFTVLVIAFCVAANIFYDRPIRRRLTRAFVTVPGRHLPILHPR
ncbi:acyltransferase [Beijerinckia sp. L45]|uniref:acyltransferase family protein n=1 Tax=Beijerinckia sp. L45 TaxID=1641855 RepID=UPI00131D5BA2|nr:acyltransferase [Beijerinckia sp. L45]